MSSLNHGRKKLLAYHVKLIEEQVKVSGLLDKLSQQVLKNNPVKVQILDVVETHKKFLFGIKRKVYAIKAKVSVGNHSFDVTRILKK